MGHWTLSILKSLIKPSTQSVKRNMSRVAVCQMTSVADKATNMSVVTKLVDDACKEDVQMIFFPEACDYIADNKQDVVKLAEPIPGGAIVSQYRAIAAKHRVWLSMGGVHEKDELNSNKMYNTHLIINSEGNIVQSYRKLHLFDFEIPEKHVRLKESDFTQAGGHIVTPVDTPVGRIGMSICYDMRFPELSTSLSIMGAEILTFPSAFTKSTGEAHWHVLLRSRAIENQCYVIAAAQTGTHNQKRTSYGHALFVTPWGETIDCGKSAPSFIVGEVAKDKLEGVRRNMPVFQHRRKDIYSLYTLSLRKDLLPDHKEGNPEIPDNVPETSKVPEGPSNVFGHVRVPESCVFYKTKLTYAFVNLRCVIPGHVLVAPVRMAERNADLTHEEAEDFFRTIRLVQRLMERVHETRSCTVTIQDGPDAGQTVKHLHCHIMPRKKNDFIQKGLIYLELSKHDQFKSGPPSKPPRSLEEMRTEAELLRRELKSLLVNEKFAS